MSKRNEQFINLLFYKTLTIQYYCNVTQNNISCLNDNKKDVFSLKMHHLLACYWINKLFNFISHKNQITWCLISTFPYTDLPVYFTKSCVILWLKYAAQYEKKRIVVAVYKK